MAEVKAEAAAPHVVAPIPLDTMMVWVRMADGTKTGFMRFPTEGVRPADDLASFRQAVIDTLAKREYQGARVDKATPGLYAPEENIPDVPRHEGRPVVPCVLDNDRA